MDKRTKRRVQGVAIFLVFLALSLAIFEFSKSRARGGTVINLKSQQAEFKKQRWLNKASFELKSANIATSLGKMNEIVDATSERTLMREIRSNHGVYMFTLNKSELDQLRRELMQVGSIDAEVEAVDTSLVNTNYEIEVANMASYAKDLAELDKIRVPSDTELRRKESLRAQIEASTQKLQALQKGDSYLVFLTITPSAKRHSLLGDIRGFSIVFGRWLIICLIGVILVYYGTKLLMYLLALMGVKGLSSRGIAGSYNYGGYVGYASKYSSRYGYGRGKRRVKRIYKEDKTTPENEGLPEE